MPNFDVVAVGNAIVDHVVQVEDSFLHTQGLKKAHMTLIDSTQMKGMVSALGTQGRLIAGGSAANTIAALAQNGINCGYIGKTADDFCGHHFAKGMQELGVSYTTSSLPESDGATAQCLVLVTPDGERTMCTDLGVSTRLSPDDLDTDLIQDSQYLYLEGYLFDRDAAKAAFYQSAKLAQDANVKVALTLSDLFCVERHRDDFLDLLNHVDLVFANESEALALFQTDDIDHAIAGFKRHEALAVVTRSQNGAMVIPHDSAPINVPTTPIHSILDATGAGDAFAAGFLQGLIHGKSFTACAETGHNLAAKILQVYGARLQE